MKKYLIILLVLVFPISTILAANPGNSRRMIQLKVKQKVEHRSIGISPVDAFVTGSQLEISVKTSFKEVTISISDNQTGEQVYCTTTNDSFIIIDLSENKTSTEYSLTILIDKDTSVSGTFEIE